MKVGKTNGSFAGQQAVNGGVVNRKETVMEKSIRELVAENTRLIQVIAQYDTKGILDMSIKVAMGHESPRFCNREYFNSLKNQNKELQQTIEGIKRKIENVGTAGASLNWKPFAAVIGAIVSVVGYLFSQRA